MSWYPALWARRAPHLSKRSATRGGEITGFTLTFLLIACAAAAADCTCRAQGRDVQHGERVCLSGPNGPRFATCGMNQNVASWVFTDEPCALAASGRALILAAGTPGTSAGWSR